MAKKKFFGFIDFSGRLNKYSILLFEIIPLFSPLILFFLEDDLFLNIYSRIPNKGKEP